MKKNKKQLSYEGLAWTELIISSPSDYADYVDGLAAIIKKHSPTETQTLLHLGCGAGVYDYTLKNHFQVAGVDLSKSMLKIAGKLNPDVAYTRGDMRKIRLKKTFDAVIIPDAIGYMTSVKDLRKAIRTACRHLKNGGVLLIVTHLNEEFKENNFVYTGEKGNVRVTIFENNYITGKNEYEATIVYLIRKKGKFKVYTDVHKIGLFSSSLWNNLLTERGFSVQRLPAADIYDRFMLAEGEYPQVMLVCKKSKHESQR
ncbi:class I SAM-dependent methyltransferase [candidate division KSB1 bacterium]|nr:class I SAM-dependent methyltransferase [candidate division KSB1 bacterium]